MINSELFIYIMMIVLLVAAFIFWLWMLYDMLTNKKLTKIEKGIWFILFFATSLITAIVWLVVRKNSKRGKKS